MSVAYPAMKMGNRCTVKCRICGTHGHADKKCPVYELNRQQEAIQADREKLVAIGLNPDLEAQIEGIRESWKKDLQTISLPIPMPQIGQRQVSAGFATRAAELLSAKFKRCAYLVLFCLLLPHLHAGTITGQIQTATGGVINNGTLGFTLSQPAVLSGTATLSTAQAYCYTSTAGNIVGLPDPLALPVLSTNTGSGTLAAGTYYVKLTYYGAGGETVASPEMSVVLSAQGTVIVNAPTLQPASATGYNVYIGATSGSETLQATIVGFTQYQQTSALVSGAALPSSNTTVCSLVFSDQLIPTGTYYTVSFVNKNGSMISGFPETWCTFGGSAGTINVSNGAPTGNCGTNGVFYPTPIFANPQNGAAQSVSSPFTFQSNVTFNGSATFNGSMSFAQGIVAPFFSSSSINPAQSGIFRLANGDQICWRNNANSADVCVSKNTSDQVVVLNLAPTNLSVSGTVLLTGTLGLSETGVFTNTQMNDYLLSALNSCSPATEFSIEQAGNFATEGVTGCVAVPVSGNVHQANGVAGYVNNSSTSINAVAGYFSARCAAANCHVWGINPVADDHGNSGVSTLGAEVDVNLSGATPNLSLGIAVEGIQNTPADPGTVGNLARSAVSVYGGFWNNGFSCNIGRLKSSTLFNFTAPCVLALPIGGGNSQPSSGIALIATNSGGSSVLGFMDEDPNGVLTVVGSPLRLGTVIFSALPSCTSAIEGAMEPVTDSTTATWGATITGSGGNHVLAYCDGINWTVAAK